jgi:predicted restriction endonuclease
MKFNIVPAIGPKGDPANKLVITEGGYKKFDLPVEYLKGDCFWIKKGKHPAIVLRTRTNPITQETTDIREIIKVPLSRTFTNGELERLIAFMRDCGETLVKTKELYASGFMDGEPIELEI